MYRRPKFLEVLLQIRREMAQEADYDVDLFAELARSGSRNPKANKVSQQTNSGAASQDVELVDFQKTRGVIS